MNPTNEHTLVALGYLVCIDDEDQETVAHCMLDPQGLGGEQAIMYARLFAAAPGMLAALGGLLPFSVSTEAQFPSERKAYGSAWNAAHATIALARQRSST